jgi:hypothetical protein
MSKSFYDYLPKEWDENEVLANLFPAGSYEGIVHIKTVPLIFDGGLSCKVRIVVKPSSNLGSLNSNFDYSYLSESLHNFVVDYFDVIGCSFDIESVSNDENYCTCDVNILDFADFSCEKISLCKHNLSMLKNYIAELKTIEYSFIGDSYPGWKEFVNSGMLHYDMINVDDIVGGTSVRNDWVPKNAFSFVNFIKKFSLGIPIIDGNPISILVISDRNGGNCFINGDGMARVAAAKVLDVKYLPCKVEYCDYSDTDDYSYLKNNYGYNFC